MILDAYMPVPVPPVPSRRIPAGPGPLKRCPTCEATFQRAGAIYCSDSCRWKAWDAKRRMDPQRVAYIRQRNATRYKTEAPNFWLLAAPPYGEFLPGASMALVFRPSLAIAEHQRHLLHGMMTALLGKNHEPLMPAWRLFPVDAGSGWGVHVYSDEDVTRLCAHEWPGKVGKAIRALRFVGRARLRSPLVPKRGRRRLTITALTPVCVRNPAEYRQQPTDQNIISALRDRVCQHVGLKIAEDRICLRILDARTEPRATPRLGHLDGIRGWVGDVDVECNAIAAWLLLVAARCTGLGSKTAYGFGAIVCKSLD